MMRTTPKTSPKPPSKSRAKVLTLSARLDRIRRKADLTEYRFAQVLGMSQQQYYNMKVNSQRVTKAWDIALKAMEKYGLEFLALDLTRPRKP